MSNNISILSCIIQNGGMPPSSKTAWIAAVTSLFAAIISSVSAFLIKRKEVLASKDLAALNARLAYEYDAKKRLYQEFEPLRFALREAAEAAYYRILNLAQSAKRGDLEPKKGWLSHEGYYLRSTIYKLLAPSAIFRLMQRKLTLVDLNADPTIAASYEVAKTIYLIWTEDFKFAKLDPKVEYDPHAAPLEAIQDLSGKYIQQGIPSGYLDRSLDALVMLEKGEPPRLKNYGEFETAFRTEGSDTRESNVVLLGALLNFHPAARPVLWRMLITQTTIYYLLKENLIDADSTKVSLPPVEFAAFDWRQTKTDASSNSGSEDPFRVANTYLLSREQRHSKGPHLSWAK